MMLKERISWLMGRVQQSLFPHLDEWLPVPLTDSEKHLVKILELIQVDKFIPNSDCRQWMGRPIKEREMPGHLLPRQFVSISIPVH